MNNYIRFERATVDFGGITVDGCRMPNGEFRVGIVGAAEAIGYERTWLSQVVSRRPKTLEDMRSLGFVGCQLEGVVENSEKNGNGTAKTISLDDFNKLILYAVTQKKDKAIALMLSLSKMTLLDFFRDAFNERPLTIEEKRELFYKEYAKTIDWLQEDKDDWQLIIEQQMFLSGAI